MIRSRFDNPLKNRGLLVFRKLLDGWFQGLKDLKCGLMENRLVWVFRLDPFINALNVVVQ